VAALFGSAIVVALNQAQPVLVAAEQEYLAGGACQVQCSVFDNAGNPLAPIILRWRMDDLASDTNVIPWTPIAEAGPVSTVNISATQNAMISFTRDYEERQVMFSIEDSSGAVYQADTRYVLKQPLPQPQQGVGPL
jgi:hypothetical protein